jgi:hypothetical protein
MTETTTDTPTQPARQLTTAQRLAGYRAELLAVGFDEAEAQILVEAVAPSAVGDVELQDDVDDDTPVVGTVRVRLVPVIDPADVASVAEKVQGLIQAASRPDPAGAAQSAGAEPDSPADSTT